MKITKIYGMGRGIYCLTFEDGSQGHASQGIMYCNADMTGGHCSSADFAKKFPPITAKKGYDEDQFGGEGFNRIEQ